ncbi:MAG: DUF2304 domain-containing protein [Thermoleophilaceae bacterium]
MDVRIQIISVVLSGLLLLGLLELVRRRQLLERYALLWLLSSLVLLGLATWRGLLEEIASALGIATPTNALFFVAFAFVLVLLLHFSISVSKLADQSKVLAQRLALLQELLREAESRDEAAESDGTAEREPERAIRP